MNQRDTTLHTYYCDFHIHIGRSRGKPVKMAAAPSLTLHHLLAHASMKKGLDIVTVIDGVCTGVQQDVTEAIQQGILVSQPGGGYRYKDQLTVLLGAEVEVGGPFGGAAHFGCWFGDIESARDFSEWLRTVQKNVSLSSQRARTDAGTLAREVHQRGGVFVVHHAFTPHKGLYGNCVRRLSDMLDPSAVDAVELGLSADTDMADCVGELSSYTFLSNSDAHSLDKIAREYNALALHRPTFAEVKMALRRQHQRRVTANYGLDPRLGKYHRTYCKDCGLFWAEKATQCVCGSTRHVMGVYDRLVEIRDWDEPRHPPHRPPYVHQVPLEFVPGLGPKLRDRLLRAFPSEMYVLHKATREELANVVGERLAERIDNARRGRLRFHSGGGGVYGKLATES
jgi:uncharacterized protein (TIGR00375 family)